MQSSRWGRAGAWWVMALALVACSAGGGPASDDAQTAGEGADPVITIQDFTFRPENLEVSPGQRVTVRNLDAAGHSVTSQAAPRDYTPGSVAGVSFDTGVFTGERSFTIPESAPRGTVVPYFCRPHKDGMRNEGRITIR